MLLWIVFAVLTAFAALLVVSPYWRRDKSTAAQTHDVEVYKQQLVELEEEHARGIIGDTEAEAARIEYGMKRRNPETGIDIERQFDIPPLRPETDGAAEALVRALTGDNGTHVVSFGTEAGHFQVAGYSAVVCGPGNIAQAHQTDEFLDIAEFEAGQRLMEKLLDRLSAN